MNFLDDRGLHQIGVSCSGQKFTQLADGQINDLGLRFLHQRLGRTHYHFDITASGSITALQRCLQQLRFVEHPLDGAIQQNGMVQIRNLAVEPEMDSRDREVQSD